MAKTFGDIMRDIGRALGLGGGNASGAGGTVSSIGSQVQSAMGGSMLGGGGGGGGDGPEKPKKPTEPVVEETPDTETTETTEIIVDPIKPPKPPKPVNPSDMTSTGPSEDLALASAEQGLASTILTSGQGIVEEEPGLLRPRRKLGNSLISQGLIQ